MAAARDANAGPFEPSTGAAPNRSQLASVAMVGVVITLAICNRVFNRMALVPLQNYVFFLAQLQVFGYVAVYFSILAARRKAGQVTDAMMNIAAQNRGTFTLIGALEAASQLLLFVSAARLPGVLLPILSQSFMIWQFLLAFFVLHERYSASQIMGVALVTAGVSLAAFPQNASAAALLNVDPAFVTLYIGSLAFPALAVLFKDRIFRTAQQQLGGQRLDLFVVNSFGSLSQAAFTFLLLPLLTWKQNIPLHELPSYLARGAQCFAGLTPACGSDCSGAPLLPLLYVAANLGFNITVLNAVRLLGAPLVSLCMSLVVPLNIWVFTLPLPYLGAAPQLGSSFLWGMTLLLAGLACFNSRNISSVLAGSGKPNIKEA